MIARQAEEEAQFRKVEGAMLHVEDAARRLAEAAEELKRDEAPAYLVAALETAAGAVRADHKRLMKSVYWPAAPETQQELASASEGTQQRLAS
jgi:predicted Zn-dependent protease